MPLHAYPAACALFVLCAQTPLLPVSLLSPMPARVSTRLPLPILHCHPETHTHPENTQQLKDQKAERRGGTENRKKSRNQKRKKKIVNKQRRVHHHHKQPSSSKNHHPKTETPSPSLPRSRSHSHLHRELNVTSSPPTTSHHRTHKPTKTVTIANTETTTKQPYQPSPHHLSPSRFPLLHRQEQPHQPPSATINHGSTTKKYTATTVGLSPSPKPLLPLSPLFATLSLSPSLFSRPPPHRNHHPTPLRREIIPPPSQLPSSRATSLFLLLLSFSTVSTTTPSPSLSSVRNLSLFSPHFLFFSSFSLLQTQLR